MEKITVQVDRVWMGGVPVCDFCQNAPSSAFVDGATSQGPWANMCWPSCYLKYGRGIGPGLGQKYEHRADGKWHKVEG